MFNLIAVIGGVVNALLFSIFWPLNQLSLKIHTLLVKSYCIFAPLFQFVDKTCTPDGWNPSIADDFLAFIAISIWFALMGIYIIGFVVMSIDISKHCLVVSSYIRRLIVKIYIAVTVLVFIDTYFYHEMGTQLKFALNALLTLVIPAIAFFGAYKIIQYLRKRKK